MQPVFVAVSPAAQALGMPPKKLLSFSLQRITPSSLHELATSTAHHFQRRKITQCDYHLSIGVRLNKPPIQVFCLCLRQLAGFEHCKGAPFITGSPGGWEFASRNMLHASGEVQAYCTRSTHDCFPFCICLHAKGRGGPDEGQGGHFNRRHHRTSCRT